MKPIWSPSVERIGRANITRFIERAAGGPAPQVRDYASLHAWSVDRPAEFWSLLWDFLGIIGEKGRDIVLDPERLPGARWFPQAKLNFAENHLRRCDDAIAIVARSETLLRRTLSWRQLYDEVSRLRQALQAAGLKPGDTVAACLPNVPEAVVALLAASSLGAIWSAVSPDYGEQAALDRIGQIEPKLLILADAYTHKGEVFDLRAKSIALAGGLPSLEHAIVVSCLGQTDACAGIPHAISWEDFIAPFSPGEIVFERFGFDHPLWVLYSSGTTGKPKAIIHSAGGSLMQCLKEMALHCDVCRDDPVFFPTPTGWMIWNLLVAGLAAQATIVLHDGAPMYPAPDSMFGILADERVRVARLVPPLIESYARAGLRPAESHDLSELKCLLSGSASLLPHHYEYVYAHVKRDLHLMSPAGGTDIIGTLATGNPAGAVYPGEIQVPSLGMKVEIFDEQGASLIGQAGELVCTRAFPSVPLGFWGDRSEERRHEAYFSMFPGVWRHGDWAEITPRGGIVIYGRADATLKVNGVRIGSAEIYRGLEGFSAIREAVAVTQRHEGVDRILLFVLPAAGAVFDEELERRIKAAIRTAASARHVPARVIAVPDIPRSMNGKPSEIAVRDAVNGRLPANAGGIANPAALENFRGPFA